MTATEALSVAPEQPSTTSASVAARSGEQSCAATVSVAAAPPQAATPTPAARVTAGFATPERVPYDPANDRCLMSNINDGPTDVNNNGRIAEPLTDGKVAKAKKASSVLRGKVDAKFEVTIPGLKAPANAANETRRKRLHFTENSVEVFDLP